MNSTKPSLADYCAGVQNESTKCLGWCPNPEIGGIGAMIATFVQAVACGMSYLECPLRLLVSARQGLKDVILPHRLLYRIPSRV
jgi:hypothetical protein